MPSFPMDEDDRGTCSLSLSSGLTYKPSGVGRRNFRMKKKKKGVITANFSGTKYQIVRLAILDSGFTRAQEEDDTANLIWNDAAVQQERIADLCNYQRINHFPGMGEICRKDCLARNMAKMIKSQSQEYCFTPRTWIFPAEYTQFQNCIKELRKKRRQKTYIVKPANGAMGHGISLIRNGDKLQAHEHLIVQEYLDKPFLLEGYKFDLRIYILVTSCDPLRIFLYNDGLVRMGTEKYHTPTDANLKERLAQVRKQISREEHENQNLGDLPADDKELLEKYEPAVRGLPDLLGQRAASLQKELSNPLNHMKEEDILDLLEQCEEDDEKLLGKSPRQRGPKPLFSMPETTDNISRKQKGDSSSSGNSSCSTDSEGGAVEEKKTTDFELERNFKYPVRFMEERETEKEDSQGWSEKERQQNSGSEAEDKSQAHHARHWCQRSRIPRNPPALRRKPPACVPPAASVPIRRSTSCPRSISSLASPAQSPGAEPRSTSAKPAAAVSRLAAGLRSQSLNRTAIPQQIPHSISLGTIHSGPGKSRQLRESSPNLCRGKHVSLLNFRTKEQEEELVRETQAALNEMRIKFPGKSNEEAEVLLDEILDNWKYHKPKVATYWLVKLDCTKQRKVLDIVRVHVRSIVQRVWKAQDVETLRLHRIFNRVFSRLLWSHGQGLWNCFSNSGRSTWETMLNRKGDGVTPLELQCCQRLVQICKDCLLLVYRYAADFKGSLPGLRPRMGAAQVPAPHGPTADHEENAGRLWLPGLASIAEPLHRETGPALSRQRPGFTAGESAPGRAATRPHPASGHVLPLHQRRPPGPGGGLLRNLL
ncbi:tubulin polyglutamylase TTLL7 [Rhinoraja longicauda]